MASKPAKKKTPVAAASAGISRKVPAPHGRKTPAAVAPELPRRGEPGRKAGKKPPGAATAPAQRKKSAATPPTPGDQTAIGAQRGPGRPSLYTEELATEILDRLSEGQNLVDICAGEGMPKVRTVNEWAADKEAHPAFSAGFARAREEGAHAIAREALRIADEPRRVLDAAVDRLAAAAEAGDLEAVRAAQITLEKVRIDHPDLVARDRLRVETRLKLLARWFPKIYGEKVQLADADGEKLEAPPPPQWHIHPVAPRGEG